jgi:hypothetical protein
LTALFIVVFGSDTDVRLVQDACAASVFEASGAVAANAKVCAVGGMNVLAMASAATTGATTTDTRGRISFCNIVKSPNSLDASHQSWCNVRVTMQRA